ncbi:hypothetical protein Cni_G14120 [Canna indica]|uniref:E3 ubiquitin-protein ligase RMA n=1 Tax=Canna indica TaxID=4628 RepID=A0AAQ3KB92_9LILI|nr:hypothetical protein Cni_G14120 [Canna indica]
MNDSFHCNICLDFAVDPIVTFCGHLYCWPCIYKWMQLEGTSHQRCPVCKALISQHTIVPLYGGYEHHSAKRNPGVPPRSAHPPLSNERTPIFSDFERNVDHHQPIRRQPQVHPHSSEISGSVVTILTWVLGGHRLSIQDANPYHYLSLSGGNPRVRRQLKQVETSLHEMSLLLFFFAVICLLLF